MYTWNIAALYEPGELLSSLYDDFIYILSCLGYSVNIYFSHQKVCVRIAEPVKFSIIFAICSVDSFESTYHVPSGVDDSMKHFY